MFILFHCYVCPEMAHDWLNKVFYSRAPERKQKNEVVSLLMCRNRDKLHADLANVDYTTLPWAT